MATKIKIETDKIVARIGNMDLNVQQATRIINDIGWDAGNASMRKAGRTTWSRADYNVACRTTDRLFKNRGFAT